MYRKNEVFLVHPGGPFFKNRDNVWSVPKGEQHDGEDLLETAKREFCEETNIVIPAFEPESIGFVKYNNKLVYCWAFESDLPKEFIFKSNKTPQGWDENDRGEFFDLETAKLKIIKYQLLLLLSFERIHFKTKLKL